MIKPLFSAVLPKCARLSRSFKGTSDANWYTSRSIFFEREWIVRIPYIECFSVWINYGYGKHKY